MNTPSKLSKEQLASRKIIEIIQNDAFPIGARLPSERRLAQKLEMSRNTLRSAMRLLSAHGIVDIRSGSGNYILNKEIPNVLTSADYGTNGSAPPAEVLEARYLVEPVIGGHAATSAKPEDIDGLESCLMRMSRASIDNLTDRLIQEDKHFRKLLALSTGNRLLAALHACIADQNDGSVLAGQLPEKERASLFADYVGIFNAVQDRDPKRAHERIEHHVLRQCRLLVDGHVIEMPETVSEALRHRIKGFNDHEPPEGSIP